MLQTVGGRPPPTFNIRAVPRRKAVQYLRHVDIGASWGQQLDEGQALGVSVLQLLLPVEALHEGGWAD